MGGKLNPLSVDERAVAGSLLRSRLAIRSNDLHHPCVGRAGKESRAFQLRREGMPTLDFLGVGMNDCRGEITQVYIREFGTLPSLPCSHSARTASVAAERSGSSCMI